MYQQQPCAVVCIPSQAQAGLDPSCCPPWTCLAIWPQEPNYFFKVLLGTLWQNIECSGILVGNSPRAEVFLSTFWRVDAQPLRPAVVYLGVLGTGHPSKPHPNMLLVLSRISPYGPGPVGQGGKAVYVVIRARLQAYCLPPSIYTPVPPFPAARPLTSLSLFSHRGSEDKNDLKKIMLQK